MSAKTAASQSDRPIFRISDFPISIHRFASTTSQKRFHPERLKARHLSHDARPAFAFSLCSRPYCTPFDISYGWHKPTATLRLNAPTASRLPKYTRRLHPLSRVPSFGSSSPQPLQDTHSSQMFHFNYRHQNPQTAGCSRLLTSNLYQPLFTIRYDGDQC